MIYRTKYKPGTTVYFITENEVRCETCKQFRPSMAYAIKEGQIAYIRIIHTTRYPPEITYYVQYTCNGGCRQTPLVEENVFTNLKKAQATLDQKEKRNQK